MKLPRQPHVSRTVAVFTDGYIAEEPGAFALVATGFVAIYRVTRVVNFAQGAFAVLAGMLAYTLLGAGVPHVIARFGHVP